MNESIHPPGASRAGAAVAEAVVQRVPAEVRYADELEQLRAEDSHPVPAGWCLSPRAVETFVLGDPARGIERKFVAEPGLVTRLIISLCTDRGCLLAGPPGTAKSWLSELLAAAISGDSTLTLQGGAVDDIDQLLYSWNRALLTEGGPRREALVPSPLFRGMLEGRIVRFEELARCPQPLQDALLTILSDRMLTIPELPGPEGVLSSRVGFNVIATSNDADAGLHQMSAALKRRLNFEVIAPIRVLEDELDVIRQEVDRRNAESGIEVEFDDRVLEVLVTLFRELRTGQTLDGRSTDRLAGASLSTAEAVGVAHALSIHAFYYADGRVGIDGVVHFVLGTVLKDDPRDRRRFLHYLESEVTRKRGSHWAAIHAQRHLV